jgi:hypothetical protein
MLQSKIYKDSIVCNNRVGCAQRTTIPFEASVETVGWTVPTITGVNINVILLRMLRLRCAQHTLQKLSQQFALTAFKYN